MSGTEHPEAPPDFRGRCAAFGANRRLPPLSPRLAAVASFVPRGSVVTDVGTDHAYVPIWLLQNGVCERAYATDRRTGPLENAAADARRCGVSGLLTLRCCDGLTACAPEESDTVILAGMGGETMLHILSASPWAFGKRLILQPQTQIRTLRAALGRRGLAVLDAALARDAGRIYLIWRVGPGTPETPEPAVDRVLIEKRDPLLPDYAAALLARERKRLAGPPATRRPRLKAISQMSYILSGRRKP